MIQNVFCSNYMLLELNVMDARKTECNYICNLNIHKYHFQKVFSPLATQYVFLSTLLPLTQHFLYVKSLIFFLLLSRAWSLQVEQKFSPNMKNKGTENNYYSGTTALLLADQSKDRMFRSEMIPLKHRIVD